MTDERMGEQLWTAIERLPINAGIVFRHYATPSEARVTLAKRIADICHDRSLAFAVAADVDVARSLGADLVHNPAGPTHDLPFSRAVHSIEEAEAAKAEGAALVFVSPIYPTRSHPGREQLAPAVALQIAKAAGVPAIALGGMDSDKFEQLKREGFYGWAGIDAWVSEKSVLRT